ncbi:MAG: phage minor head protein [Pseudomonadota bacterium]
MAASAEAIGKLGVEEDPLAVSKVSDRSAGIFAARINECRQVELCVTEYVWRTRGDHKVREDHQPRDAQVFDWDHRHRDGHPGDAPNCRCIAEPVLPDVSDEPYVPKTGLALEPVDVSSGTEGMLEAGRDLLGAAFDGLVDLLGNLFDALSNAARLIVLAANERAGTIDDNERAELAGLRRALDGRLQGSLDALARRPSWQSPSVNTFWPCGRRCAALRRPMRKPKRQRLSFVPS